MNTQEWFKNKLESFKEDFEFRLETLILEITEKISQRMKQKKINRTDLAALLEVSRPAVTKILDGNPNFTLRKLLSLADALDLELKIDFNEKSLVASKPVYGHVPEFAHFTPGASATFVTTTSILADASTSITFPLHEIKVSDLAKAVNE